MSSLVNRTASQNDDSTRPAAESQPAPTNTNDSMAQLSATAQSTLRQVRRMIPPMLPHFHKGQLGRIAVIGGSKDYTGAPYFSAMASAKLGADMSHVICEPEAAAVIKTYSPNLMVSPLMRQSGSSSSPHDSKDAGPDASAVAKPIIEMLARLHVLVCGPGLGRDPLMQDTLRHVLLAARERKMPVVIDADALMLVNTKPDLVRGWREAILTPNVVEFGRLAKALGIDVDLQSAKNEACRAVAQALDGVCLVQKGPRDVISNGELTWICDLQGGYKRSGGQGDTLTGSIGTLLCYRKAYLDKLWDTKGDIPAQELTMLAAWGGAAITRECSRLAFKAKGRSLQASDVGDQVHEAFERLIGENSDI